jgi:DHA1 family multidrug resistance protein-like MFS transporter
MYIQNVLGLGPEARGLILGIHALPFILLQYPAGKLSDTHGRYVFLISGSFGYGLLLMFSGYIGEIGMSSLAASFFFLGIFSGITAPTNAALVGDIALRDEHAMAVGFFHLAGNMGIILGPMVAGFVTDLSRFQVAFLFAGFVEIGSLGICVLLMYRFHLYGD